MLEGLCSLLPSVRIKKKPKEWPHLPTHVGEEPGAVYMLGTDVMDGSFSDAFTQEIRHLRNKISSEVKLHLINFSFRGKASAECIKILSELDNVTFTARDPISQRNFITQVNRPCSLVGDLAFILSDAAVPLDIVAWINSQRVRNRKICLYGYSALINSVDSLKSWAGAMAYPLEDRGVSFITIAHDTRDPKEQEESVRIATSLGDRGLFLNTQSSYALRGLAKLCDFFFSARMHLGIACMSQAIPGLLVPYNDKVDGLFDLVGMPVLRMDQSNVQSKFELLKASHLLLKGGLRERVKGIKSGIVDHYTNL